MDIIGLILDFLHMLFLMDILVIFSSQVKKFGFNRNFIWLIWFRTLWISADLCVRMELYWEKIVFLTNNSNKYIYGLRYVDFSNSLYSW